MKNTKKWTKFRHKVFTGLLRHTLGNYVRLKYRIKIEKLKNQGKRNYLILFNHQTAYDQFFVGLGFNGPIYYLTSEDVFANGFASALIKYLVAPIPIKKQGTDVHAIINCTKVANEGGTIAIAPEGNRTYSGETGYINPSIAPLVKKLRLPLALFKIEGGYGVHPRWADDVRHGKMRAYVSSVIEPEEYENMTNDELFSIIKEQLYVNEAHDCGKYTSKKLAEGIERAIYVCRNCGLSSFETHADSIRCKTCGETIRYLPNKRLLSENADFPFNFLLDWYNYQNDFIYNLDLKAYEKKVIFTDKIRFSELTSGKKRQLIKKEATLRLYVDKITLDEGEQDEAVFLFNELSGTTVLGKNKLNIYIKKQTYQIKGNKSFCAVKYVNMFYKYKLIAKGETNGKFLGL